MQLRGCEAVRGYGLCLEVQGGGFEGGVGAARGVKVGRVADAGAAVFVAADGVGCGGGADVEVCDF